VLGGRGHHKEKRLAAILVWLAESRVATLAALAILREHLRKTPLERQCDALAHHANAVDRVHQRLRLGVEEIIRHEVNHAACLHPPSASNAAGNAGTSLAHYNSPSVAV